MPAATTSNKRPPSACEVALRDTHRDQYTSKKRPPTARTRGCPPRYPPRSISDRQAHARMPSEIPSEINKRPPSAREDAGGRRAPTAQLRGDIARPTWGPGNAVGSTYPVHVGSAYREGSAGRRVNVSGPRECVLRPYPCCCAAGGPAVRRAPPPKRRHPKRRHQRPGRPPREEARARAGRGFRPPRFAMSDPVSPFAVTYRYQYWV